MRARTAWIWVVAAAAAGSLLVFAGLPWLLPLGQALLVWPVLWSDLRAGKPGRAAGHMLGWAFLVSLAVVALTVRFPVASEAAILRGASYREEMFRYIRSGMGAEGSPRLFIPQHFLHYGLTLALSFVTAGLAGLGLGAVLLNYMNFYVGSLILAGSEPWMGGLFGWPVWAVIRVVAFVLGAIVLAYVFLARVLHRAPWHGDEARRLFLWSVSLFLADMVVKATLAHTWRKLLVRALGPS